MNFAAVSKIVRSFPGAKLEDVMNTVRRAGTRVLSTSADPEAFSEDVTIVNNYATPAVATETRWYTFPPLTEKVAALVADRHAYTLAEKFVEDFRARARMAFDVRRGSIGRVTGGKYPPGRYEVVRVAFELARTVSNRFGTMFPVRVTVGDEAALSAKSAGSAAYANQELITAKRIIPTGIEELEDVLPVEFVDGELMERHPDGELTPVVPVEARGPKYDDIRPRMPLGAFVAWEPNVRGLFDDFTEDDTLNGLMRGAVSRDCYGFALSLIADRLEDLGMMPSEALRRTGADVGAFANHIRKLATKPKYTKPLRQRWKR